MTKAEERLYKAAEEAETEATKLVGMVHALFYDPEGGTEDDAKKMNEVISLLREAETITRELERKLHE